MTWRRTPSRNLPSQLRPQSLWLHPSQRQRRWQKLHQHGCRKVVALMGSTMSPAQEELIRKHTNRHSHVIIMLDEDEPGQVGREDIAVRLSKFCFVTINVLEKQNMQPEELTVEQV